MIPLTTTKGAVGPRFWARVAACVPGCWLWLGWVDRHGYGQVSVAGHKHGAHRVAFELEVGPIPPGLQVLHRCDQPLCVRPDHLFLGTNADNMADKKTKGRWSRGASHGSAKLTPVDVATIRSAIGRESHRALAQRFGVAPSTISMIATGRNWRSLTTTQTTTQENA